MAKYVLIGHGSFRVDDKPYLPEVLVPPDTSLRFYSDGGQPLALPADEIFAALGKTLTDWFKVVDAWEHFKPEAAAMGFQRPVYNYMMKPEPSGSRRIARALAWNAAVLTPEDAEVFYLCTGKQAAGPGVKKGCPTNALLGPPVRRGEDSEPWVPGEDDWKHHCDGILGKYAGHQLHWIACTGFEGLAADLQRRLAVLTTGPAAGPGMPLVAASDIANEPKLDKFLAELNAKNALAAKPNGSVAIAVADNVLLIGTGHDVQFFEYVRGSPHEEGQLTWLVPEDDGEPGVVVTGVRSRRDFVRTEIARFHDGRIDFKD